MRALAGGQLDARTHSDRRAVVGRRRNPVRAADRGAPRATRGAWRRCAGSAVVCADLPQRMRGIRNVIENPVGHRELGLGKRRALAKTLRQHAYTRAFILPNSFKSALIPWLARIPRRIGYVGEARGLLLNDVRRLDRKAYPRLVDRFVALAANPDEMLPTAAGTGAGAQYLERLRRDPRAGSGDTPAGGDLLPGRRVWPRQALADGAFRDAGAAFDRLGYAVWVIGSPTISRPPTRWPRWFPKYATPAGVPDLGTAIDLLATARVVVSNDSGLMHAAAAVGVPLVALFGSSSPEYTPPLSQLARVARASTSCAAHVFSACARWDTSSACANCRPMLYMDLARASARAKTFPDRRPI